MKASDWQTAVATLRVATTLVEGIQAGLSRRGFDDVRPVHGFAFAALSGDPLNTAGLALALEISKQAAAQLVAYLVERGYLTREPDPRDSRSQLLVLTDHGRACTTAAEEAAADVVAGWRERAGGSAFTHYAQAVNALATPGRLRPSW